ncbi:initiation factor 2 [Nitzschia inconspicua]|uniref:Translation initiation factor IF-2, chloroplastic n=1 Tax=Nitzschia inconspicua TaxID=303405 RepID=A0A9K3LEH8_9STRA|nr:initiation factor 2 [Nitzschia inconspicua]
MMKKIGLLLTGTAIWTVAGFAPPSQFTWLERYQSEYACNSVSGPSRTSGSFSVTSRLVALSTATSNETGQTNFNRGNNNNNDNRRRNNSGGGGTPMLKLENPLKVQRVAIEPPPRRERQENNGYDRNNNRNDAVASVASTDAKSDSKVNKKYNDDGSNNDRRSGGPKGIAGRGGGDGADGGADFGRDGRRKRQPGGARGRRDEEKGQDDSRNRGKTSLRLGTTGRKGRAADLSSRRGSLRKRDRSAEKEAKAEAAEQRRTVSLPEGPVSVAELAEIIDEKPVAVIKFLMTDLGVMATMTQSLDPATCVAVVEGFGKIVDGNDEYDDDDDEISEESALEVGFVTQEDDLSTLKPRPPVVTIMGHVDHGKTSLLDAIRNTDVTAGEAGGITQHIASYQVEHNGQKITFIDTPGHAAFTDMRERGANITDIVILVVAADDGVKQQTADSIVCARQAGVPIVVAINKCDLETADPTKVMTELTSYDILTEEFGGEVLVSKISAKQGTNLGDLLDKIMLQAEIEDLKANPDRSAEAIVIEAYVEKGLGTVATSLVKKGTLKVGDIFVAGETYGKVRALISTNDGKTRLDEAGPSVPVRIVGFEGIPSAGDPLVVMDDEQTARTLAESRQRISRERSSASYQNNLMDSIALSFGANKERREMCVLVKADVQGTAEALTRALRELKLENDEAIVSVKVLVSEAGEVSKTDVAIASVTPGTTIIAFNVAASMAAMEDARVQNIPIEYFSIVYDAIESVESRMQEILSPTPDGEYSGSALVQEVFNIGGTGNIAGSRCQDGVLRKGGNVRVMRGDKILVETRIKSLRNFKSEADSIEAGNDCGIGLIDFEEFEPGDVIECYVV